MNDSSMAFLLNVDKLPWIVVRTATSLRQCWSPSDSVGLPPRHHTFTLQGTFIHPCCANWLYTLLLIIKSPILQTFSFCPSSQVLSPPLTPQILSPPLSHTSGSVSIFLSLFLTSGSVSTSLSLTSGSVFPLFPSPYSSSESDSLARLSFTLFPHAHNFLPCSLSSS